MKEPAATTRLARSPVAAPEPGADGGDIRRVGRGHCEAWINHAGSLHQQPDCLVLAKLAQ